MRLTSPILILSIPGAVSVLGMNSSGSDTRRKTSSATLVGPPFRLAMASKASDAMYPWRVRAVERFLGFQGGLNAGRLNRFQGGKGGQLHGGSPCAQMLFHSAAARPRKLRDP